LLDLEYLAFFLFDIDKLSKACSQHKKYHKIKLVYQAVLVGFPTQAKTKMKI